MSEWPAMALQDLVAGGEISYGVVQPGVDQIDGVPIIRVRDLGGGRVDRSIPMRVAPEISARHARTVLNGGEVLVSVVGTVGEVAVVSPEFAGWNVARAIAVLRPIGVSPAWLALAFRTTGVRAAIDGLLNTTVQATLNLADLKRLPIPMPPEPERRAIAELLGALDDKIAANRRVLEIADELGRTRFEALNGDSVPLGSIATNVRDQVDPKAVRPETPYVGLEHIPRRCMWLSDFDAASNVTSAKAAFRAGDVLFAKLRPYFHKVAIAPFDGIASTDALVLRAKRPELSGFVLAAAASDGAIAATTASSEGTRMPRTKWADLASFEIPWPGDDEARRFSSEVSELAAWAGAVVRESRQLAATRDELLPLLMSGTVRVKDAKKSVEGVRDGE